MKFKSMLFIFLCTFSLMFSSLKTNACESVYKSILEEYLSNMEQELYPCSTEIVIIDGLLFYTIGGCEMVDGLSIRSLQQRINDLLSTMEPNDECSDYEPYYKSMLQELTTRADFLAEKLIELKRERMTASRIMQDTIDVEISSVLNYIKSIVQEGRTRIERIEGVERSLTPF